MPFLSRRQDPVSEQFVKPHLEGCENHHLNHVEVRGLKETDQPLLLLYFLHAVDDPLVVILGDVHLHPRSNRIEGNVG